MNIYQLLEAILEELADGRQEGESIADYKKRKADELEKHFANKEEKAKTKARAYNHQYKKEKKEWKNNPQIGAEKALDTADKALNNMIKSSDARRKKWEVQGIKKKMNKNEALEIMEAIINEVSVKRWKEAAANSLDKRKEAADTTAKNAEQTWDDYDRISRKHPEDEPQLYRLAQANDEVAGKAEDSADHAYAVTRLRTHDKANANKAIKAARKVADKRDDEFSKKLDKRTFLRMGKADQLVSADPVKSRANEALKIMEEILNELNDETVNNAWNKRIDKSIELDDKERDEFNNILKIKDRDERAKAYKEFKKKSDDRNNKEIKKEDLYVNYVKRHPNSKILKEALDLMEQIVDYADNLFELDLEQKQNISPNKVSRVKKDKNGEKVEVVSVADELFPYEGDAKQQFNQKVLAKINDMIEGTGSLEDLIQFVRKGVAMKKQAAHEGLDEEKNIFGKETGRGDLLNDVDTALGSPVKKKLADIKAKMTGCKETKVHEALDLMEEIINELNDEVKVKTGIKRLENARKAYQDFKDSSKNLDNAKKEWQQARDKYSTLRAEKKMKVGDSLRAEGEFRDKYFQANKDFYQKHDDAQAATNKLKRFSKVQNIKDPKAASDLKQEVDKFKQENK